MNQSDEGDITIRLGSETYRGNYLKDLALSDQKINELLMTQPERYVFWARMKALQRVIHEKRKFELSKYESQLYTFIRSEKERDGAKVTEKQVEMAMRRDTKLETMQNTVLRERLKLDHLEAIREAFSQRKDMLMSLGANLREEWDTTLAIREKKFEQQRLEKVAEKDPKL